MTCSEIEFCYFGFYRQKTVLENAYFSIMHQLLLMLVVYTSVLCFIYQCQVLANIQTKNIGNFIQGGESCSIHIYCIIVQMAYHTL